MAGDLPAPCEGIFGLDETPQAVRQHLLFFAVVEVHDCVSLQNPMIILAMMFFCTSLAPP
ncbi:hypothetical protein D3C81_2082020 [compost metagenome]